MFLTYDRTTMQPLQVVQGLPDEIPRYESATVAVLDLPDGIPDGLSTSLVTTEGTLTPIPPGPAIGAYLASQSETLPDVQQRGCDVIDAAAGAARARFVTIAPAQDSTYTAKYAQAQAYIAAGSPDDASAYPWIAGEATATGKSPKETAEIIVAAGDKWANVIGPKIEGLRIATKEKISAATTVDAALDAMREGLVSLQAIQ